ncbi:NAD-dependent epimerase/dehydratase family protein [Vibrio hepatarius]|uniref:NAD-dependent epimerase/dehydratase family protein n=1 Tax=Vibrio hepatarius TaxID=171383 RepID=UPI00148CE610|nr:NAD-dependent epimerase/dehydratase family protein [Vibrio hepatarius]NOI13400.1 NAD-dependent epimerase/dehydratase family protein [Vibrio hepatarius]
MDRCLVTGANGHLGNNLVRALSKQGHNVRAGIRNPDKSSSLAGVDCEIVYCDLLDKASLQAALQDIDTLYQVAAVFKHWAEDEEKEIVEPNLLGTRNILQAAYEAGVKRVVYVSSIATLEQTRRNEDGEILVEGYNVSDQLNPYCRAKTLAEQEAWKVADELDLDMVTVLPSTILGGEFKPSTESLDAFSAIVNGKMPFLYELNLSPIDVNDVVNGMISAAKLGLRGKRYVLANTTTISSEEIIDIAREINPALVAPKILSEPEIYALVDQAEAEALSTNTRPKLIRSNVARSLKHKFIFDQKDSLEHLNHAPISAKTVVRETMQSLYQGQ